MPESRGPHSLRQDVDAAGVAVADDGLVMPSWAFESLTAIVLHEHVRQAFDVVNRHVEARTRQRRAICEWEECEALCRQAVEQPRAVRRRETGASTVQRQSMG
jgi:hypothetical protein